MPKRLVASTSAKRARRPGRPPPKPSIVLRAHQPGDIGWVVSRHGALYAQEYGWDVSFEALVARIAADFIDKFKPGMERAWIAELDGERVGAIFIVRKSRTTAKLRMLLIEPKARGLGLGKRLVAEAIVFARAAGYRKITLWTHDILVAARGIYQQAGFKLVSSEPNRAFGKRLTTEVWELTL